MEPLDTKTDEEIYEMLTWAEIDYLYYMAAERGYGSEARARIEAIQTWRELSREAEKRGIL